MRLVDTHVSTPLSLCSHASTHTHACTPNTVLATEDVFLQESGGDNGSDVKSWRAVGEGISRLDFCRDYSSLQYFVLAKARRGATKLFEHTITVSANYHVASLKTHELRLGPDSTVAITFQSIRAAHAFALGMSKALPPGECERLWWCDGVSFDV